MKERTATEKSEAIYPPASPIAYESEVISRRGCGCAKMGTVGGRPFVRVSGSERVR